MEFPRIYCNDVSYRSGCVEVLPNIHRGFVNLEVWHVHPDYAERLTDMSNDSSRDDFVAANTEIELNVAQAKELIRLLGLAIQAVEGRS